MSVSPRAAHVRKDWGDDDSETDILHVDMDSFFAAVEVALAPALRGKPVMVGGVGDRGVVTSATYDLRALGIRAGMPMAQARALAPSATVMPGRRGTYSEYSRRVMAVLSQVSADFEPISIDEAFLDVGGARRRLGSPLEIAQMIRIQIRDQLGLPASVGIGNSKTVAKIASSHAKPDGVLLVPASCTVQFLWSLPVGALPGVGKKTRQALEEWGISQVSQLAQVGFAELSRVVGPSLAHDLLRIAQGNDQRQVGARAPEKSISTENTFRTNLTERRAIEKYLLRASHDCAARLRESNLVAWTVTVKLRDAQFRTFTRAQTLRTPTDLGREVAAAALQIFSKEAIPRGGVRLAGVGVSGLQHRDIGVQGALDEDPRPLAAERTMDRVRERYGDAAILPATLLNRDAHVSAGRPEGDKSPAAD